MEEGNKLSTGSPRAPPASSSATAPRSRAPHPVHTVVTSQRRDRVRSVALTGPAGCSVFSSVWLGPADTPVNLGRSLRGFLAVFPPLWWHLFCLILLRKTTGILWFLIKRFSCSPRQPRPTSSTRAQSAGWSSPWEHSRVCGTGRADVRVGLSPWEGAGGVVRCFKDKMSRS